VVSDDISIVNFGEYAIAQKNSLSVLGQLSEVFQGDDAIRIYTMGLIWFVNGYTFIKEYKPLYEQSWLSVVYPDLAMSEEAVSSFLKSLGRRHGKIETFEKNLIDNSSGLIAIDGHVILSCSNECDMVSFGNKYRQLHNTQQNFMTAFDVELNRPLSVKAFDGGTLDKTEVKNLFKAYSFRNAVFIVDSGFYSPSNIRLFSSNGNRYLVPVPGTYTSIYKQMDPKDGFDGEFVYKKGSGKKTHASIISYKDKTINGRRYILCRDEEMRIKQKAEYLAEIGIEDGFTEEKYKELDEYFGTILIETNMTDSAQAVYETYKKRWKVETYYNHVKNGITCKGTHKRDYYELQGESFIMEIEGLIYSEFMKAVQQNEEKSIRSKSENECIKLAAYMKLSKHMDGQWHKNEIRANIKEFLQALNVNVDTLQPNGLLACDSEAGG
jgi:transposase